MTFLQQTAIKRFLLSQSTKLEKSHQPSQIQKLYNFSTNINHYSEKLTKVLQNIREISQYYQGEIQLIVKILYVLLKFFNSFTILDKKLIISIIANVSTYFPEVAFVFLNFIQINFPASSITIFLDPQTDTVNFFSTFFRLLMNLSKQLNYVPQNYAYKIFLSGYTIIYRDWLNLSSEQRFQCFAQRQDAGQNFVSTAKNFFINYVQFLEGQELGRLLVAFCDFPGSALLIERGLVVVSSDECVVDEFARWYELYNGNGDYMKLLAYFSKDSVLEINFDAYVIEILNKNENVEIIDQILCNQNNLRDQEWNGALAFEWDFNDGNWQFLQWAQ